MARTRYSGHPVAVVRSSIEVDRPAASVFPYLARFELHAEWQPSLISAEVGTAGPVRVGTRVIERRKTPVGMRDVPFEIIEHDPPRRLSFRGTAGPVRPIGTATVEPISETCLRIRFELELEGRGIGKLIAPFALRQSAKEIPHRLQGYKTVLESGQAD